MSKPSRRALSRRRGNLGIAAAGLAAPTLLFAPFATAADDPALLSEVIVTATRRTESVQDVPINITALGGDALEAQGVSSLSELMRSVPGFFVVNQGARTANRVVARGLNATPVSPTDTMGNNAGGTVSTYMGEVPLYVDLDIVDLERVEVLLGPQGTLYGAGTMGGAVRYIPRRPSLAETSLTVNGGVYGMGHSDGIGAEGGLVLNVPVGETFAFRAVANYREDPGFIDYGFLVREAGVSNPQPDFGNPASVDANLRSAKDANDMQMLSGRLSGRWKPNDQLDLNLTYYYQKQDAGGRNVNHMASFGTDSYTSAARFLEPNERENQLLALEIEADLGFATLTSASGYSRYDEKGQRDQTDLLFTLEYSYEAFPSFSAFTLEMQEDRTFSQELRLVSNTSGALDWLIGGFYNRSKTDGSSREFTPGFDQFAVDNFGGAGLRPDSLEYYSVGTTDLEELAFFGELTWHITDRWQVTAGGRWYDYTLETQSAVDTPLFNTVFGGAGPDEINLDFQDGGQQDDGMLWKFNTSFDFTEEMLGYFTVSEGYRIGNSNGVALCPDPLPANQFPCATPGEFQFFPDSTVNYEVGLRSQWLERRLTVNAALYYIDWKDPQLAARTASGALPITVNGAGAESQGIEINFDAQLTDRLRLWGNYAYVQAELSTLAPGLITTIPAGGGFKPQVSIDGEVGDRLPGSPEHQGSLNLRYEAPLGNEWQAGFTYGIAAVSDVLTTTGGKGDGEALAGYTIHYAAIDLSSDAWTFTLYADNLFDKYAETGVRGNAAYVQSVSDIDGNPVPVRYYFKEVLRPLEFGLRFRYDFNL
jgi:iron complex outermembrane receptor protein